MCISFLNSPLFWEVSVGNAYGVERPTPPHVEDRNFIKHARDKNVIRAPRSPSENGPIPEIYLYINIWYIYI